jgi:hypothetical protein
MTINQMMFIAGFVIAAIASLWWKFKHHHQWGKWSKPYALNREREIIDMYDMEDTRISRWQSFHQTRTCDTCGAVQVRGINPDIRIRDE